MTPASFMLPAHYPLSAWVTHAPFAAWVVDVLRPSAIAELGTHLGYSCFAFAEAARRIGIPTQIYAIDTWEGDDHAGFYGEEVLESVRAVVDADYPDSIHLLRSRFDEARPQFADGSIDLLHIDGRHGYEDVLEDYTLWRSAVRDGGVILFHDIAERENGFGVWRLWEEVAEPGRSFAFEHGHGLGVLAVGSGHPPALDALFSADETTQDRIRNDYVELGDQVTRQIWLDTLPAEIEKVHVELRAQSGRAMQLQAALDERRAKAVELETQLAAIQQSTSWKVTSPLRAVGRIVPRRR